MLDLFHSFWWLLFPLSWVAVAGWNAWLAHKARRDAMDLIQTYVRSGRDAPPELLARLNRA
ncbi:MAG: hypothetical protein B7Z44_10130 [Caulobacter sp. 12-67-6]|nr:MAG: hypothetical protein B7Z44_10130 [Caulobacter sp. 12-67-6]OYX71278.1 MAG: hypothetical protein B7Y81_09405 [Caulobacter sp. 32-67-35]OYX94561.1 MAG: hypothetical protein B7Y78_06520 [Caulobacter sp. 35-67-4]HQR91160.1 hypothetical protein [Caulobacter sp.]